jgi:hypothetical protein
MGRLPAKFADKVITFRIPYSMPGELVVAPSSQGTQFPEATFLHNVDKPFEIHRFIPRTTALDDSTPPAVINPQPTAFVTDKLIRLRINDTSKNEQLTKNAHLIDTMVPNNERLWEWEDPYTLVRSEGFQVSIDAQVFPAGIDNIRVEIAFQGFLIVIAPPTETR